LYYNWRSTANGPYGANRSINLNAYVVSGTSNTAAVYRGNEQVYAFNQKLTPGGPATFY